MEDINPARPTLSKVIYHIGKHWEHPTPRITQEHKTLCPHRDKRYCDIVTRQTRWRQQVWQQEVMFSCIKSVF